jgi:Pyruvate/2-oxoacid:ferredoxin oxidoreductase delta subunit
VTVLALEREAQMPAQREEVLAAVAEGIELLCGAMLRSAARAAGGVKLECSLVNFEDGRIDVRPGTDFRFAADAVITAIGQDPRLAPLGWPASGGGALVATDARGATTSAGVYAGGDAASLQRFVTHAIGMGMRAALEIDRWLRGEPAAPQEARPAVPFAAINTWYHARAPRAPGGREAAAQVAQALAEAARCFSCGECTFCDNCLVSCPDMAVRRANGGYEIDGDYCKGCGLCVAECPTGSIAMAEELR